MKPEDFVYDNVFTAGMRGGLTDRDSGTVAVMALERWRKGKFKKAIDVFSWADKEIKTKKRTNR